MTGASVRRLVLGALETNCWLVSETVAGPLIVIDPAGDAEALLDEVSGRDVVAVVLTHGHFDHLGAATALVRATGAPLVVHEADAAAVTDAVRNGGAMFGLPAVGPAPDRVVRDGETITVGALALQVIHTPGHTPGSICLLASAPEPPQLFSGDTLFARGVGRTDLAGGDARALQRSIARLAGLDPVTEVHPGHGPDTTIALESRLNFFWPRA